MNYISTLDKKLENAVLNFAKPFDDFAILFSGGLDSSLLAKICLDTGLKPTLISVYMRGSIDAEHTKNAKKNFDTPYIEKHIDTSEVNTYTKEVVELIGGENFIDVSIGVPLYAGFKQALESGFKAVMVGQGADELFLGYHRYLRMGRDERASANRFDVENINIQRDITLAGAFGLTLIAPYFDEAVVKFGLTIPVENKIKNRVRKHVLREVAKKRGLPEIIWSREKKAIQYSTGVDKVVRKVLKHA